MKTPFPGMDPYLEHHALWPDVHNSLIASIRDAIVPQIAPNYFVRLESRAYIMAPDAPLFLGRPDVAIGSRVGVLPTIGTGVQTVDSAEVLDVEVIVPDEINHHYLELRSTQTSELITLIEVLSPVNKFDSEGRKTYVQKRDQVLWSRTNFIEIDLLRGGLPMPIEQQVQSDYRVLVKRGWTRQRASLYAFNLTVPIPDIALPLQENEPEAVIPLNQLLHDMYTRARFDLQIDYGQPPLPPLTESQATWASGILSSVK